LKGKEIIIYIKGYMQKESNGKLSMALIAAIDQILKKGTKMWVMPTYLLTITSI
jgi:hypothetical protein